jgi:hypothetical protein
LGYRALGDIAPVITTSKSAGAFPVSRSYSEGYCISWSELWLSMELSAETSSRIVLGKMKPSDF